MWGGSLMIVYSIEEVKSQPIFFHLRDFIDSASVYVKLEGFNVAGSIKLKAARFLMNRLETSGQIQPEKSIIIESSSGNLAIALALICKERHYHFVCVVDPNILPEKESLLRLYGAELIKVTERDASGGYLATRIKTIESLVKQDSRYVWTNQYKNQSNIEAHYKETAEEIFSEMSKIDYLFVGAGTTGTLMGCIKYCQDHQLNTEIIAVDTVGSVTFGGAPAPRYIPGIGTSRRPELLDASLVAEVVFVKEIDAVKMCRYLLDQYGLFLGGSSGSVLHAIQAFAKKKSMAGTRIVAISPDFGHPYAETVYNPKWTEAKFGA